MTTIGTLANPISFSRLKSLALSPMHFAAYISDGETSREMDIGTIAHKLLLGSERAVVCAEDAEGEIVRNPKHKRYQDFLATCPPGALIVKAHELKAAGIMAGMVRKHDDAAEILDAAVKEQSLTWEMGGLCFKTRGVDFAGGKGWGELKTTRSSSPRRFMSQAWGMHYHVQLATYRQALRANFGDPGQAYWIAVENAYPHPVTVLRVGDDILAAGDAVLATWLETLRNCIASDHWPAYAQGIVDAVPPDWAGKRDDDE
jgi:hypothetical protein